MDAQKIYDVLMSEDFAVWYENEFMSHVEGDDEHMTYEQSKEKTLLQIKSIFNIKP